MNIEIYAFSVTGTADTLLIFMSPPNGADNEQCGERPTEPCADIG